MIFVRLTLFLLLGFVCFSCGDDDADELGIGAACTEQDVCAENQTCLTSFKGGYCGSIGCTINDDCPENSACIAHDDGQNYCFRICVEKTDCNANRTVDVEANCSSSVIFASGQKEGKVCVPPSSN